MDNEYLCWINLIGTTSEGLYTYEFLFTEEPDSFFGEDFDNKPLGLCNNLKPYDNAYNLTKIVKTTVKLDLVQSNCCFGFIDCIDGAVALAWENIDDYEDYPDYRLILQYAESYDDVEKKLADKQILFEE